MEVEVVLNVVLVAQVKLFGVEFDSMALIGGVICTILQQGLEVLSTKLDQFLGLLPDDLLDEVLKDAGEGIGNIDLLCCENSHLAHV